MPTLPPDGWQYRHVPLHRSELLMLRASLDELIADIVASVAICDVDFKEPCDEAKREKVTANRISFRLCPINIGGRDAADRLLNGAYGLRAHYCLSPEEGSRATGVICRALAYAIHAHTIGTTGNIAKQHIAELSQLLGGSLTKSSAKVWFDASVDKRPPAIATVK